MHTYIKREIRGKTERDLKNFPVVAILGTRQCGKSTLAKKIGETLDNFLYLDLELPSNIQKLAEPELFLKANEDKIICLDEIQRRPEIFPVLRGVIDKNRKNGKFIILGSASGDLLQQSSESLAGRISYINLTPFTLTELDKNGKLDTIEYWTRGGYPDSFFAKSGEDSFNWRSNFVRTFLERDIPQLGIDISSLRLHRFLQMCAHLHGQTINSQKIGDSIGVSHNTIRKYIDIFEKTFIFRTLPPFFSNTKKRIIKSPKLYLRDSGILHTLLDITNYNNLLGNPIFGMSWEGFALENILNKMYDWRASFYRSSSGVEIDLILEKGEKRIAIEFKASQAPQVTKGFWLAMDDLKIDEAWIVSPIEGDGYPLEKNVSIIGLKDFLNLKIDKNK